MTALSKLVKVKGLVWLIDGPDVVVAGQYSITSDGYTYRLYFGEALLDTTQSDKGFSALYPSAQRHQEYRVMAALKPTELVAELVETLNCSLQFVERLEARSGAATETGNMQRATLAKLEASE